MGAGQYRAIRRGKGDVVGQWRSTHVFVSCACLMYVCVIHQCISVRGIVAVIVAADDTETSTDIDVVTTRRTQTMF